MLHVVRYLCADPFEFHFINDWLASLQLDTRDTPTSYFTHTTMVGKGLRVAAEAGDNDFNRGLGASTSATGTPAKMRNRNVAVYQPAQIAVQGGFQSNFQNNNDYSYVMIDSSEPRQQANHGDRDHGSWHAQSEVLDVRGDEGVSYVRGDEGASYGRGDEGASYVIDGFSPIVIPAPRCSSTHRSQSRTQLPSRGGTPPPLPQQHPQSRPFSTAHHQYPAIHYDDNDTSFVIAGGSSPVLLLHTPAALHGVVGARRPPAPDQRFQQQYAVPSAPSSPQPSRPALARSPCDLASPNTSYVIAGPTTRAPAAMIPAHSAMLEEASLVCAERGVCDVNEDGASPIMITSNPAPYVASRRLHYQQNNAHLDARCDQLTNLNDKYKCNDDEEASALDHRSYSQVVSMTRACSEVTPSMVSRPAGILRSSRNTSLDRGEADHHKAAAEAAAAPAVAAEPSGVDYNDDYSHIIASPPPPLPLPAPTPRLHSTSASLLSPSSGQNRFGADRSVSRGGTNSNDDASFYWPRHSLMLDEPAETAGPVAPPPTALSEPSGEALQVPLPAALPQLLANNHRRPPSVPSTATEQALRDLETLQQKRRGTMGAMGVATSSEDDDARRDVHAPAQGNKGTQRIALRQDDMSTPVAPRRGAAPAKESTGDVADFFAPSPAAVAFLPAAVTAAVHHDPLDDDVDQEIDERLNSAASSCRRRSVTLSLGGDTPMVPQKNENEEQPRVSVFDEELADDAEKEENHDAVFNDEVPAIAAPIAPSTEAQRFVAAFRDSVEKSRASILSRLSDSSISSATSSIAAHRFGDSARHTTDASLASLVVQMHGNEEDDHPTPRDDPADINVNTIREEHQGSTVSANSSINLSWMMLPEGGATTSVLKRARGGESDDDDDNIDDDTVDEPHARGLPSRRASVSPKAGGTRAPQRQRGKTPPVTKSKVDTRRLENQSKGVSRRLEGPTTAAAPPPEVLHTAASARLQLPTSVPHNAARLPTVRASSVMQGQLADTPKLRLSKEAVSKLLTVFTQEGEGGRVWQRLRAAIKQHASTETGGAPMSTVTSSSSSSTAADKDLKIELRVLAQVLLSFVRVANGSSTFVKQRMSAGDVFRGIVALYVEQIQRCRALTSKGTPNEPSSQPNSLPTSRQSSRASSLSRPPPTGDEDEMFCTAPGSGVRDLICAAAGGSSLLAAPSPFVVFVERRATAAAAGALLVKDHDEEGSTAASARGGIVASMKSFSHKLTSSSSVGRASLARPLGVTISSFHHHRGVTAATSASTAAAPATWVSVPVHFAEYDCHSKSLCDVGKFWEGLRKLRRAELMLNAASGGSGAPNKPAHPTV